MTKAVFDRYVTYNNSDIEGVSEVPEHWKVKRVKDELNSLDYKRIPLSGEIRGQMTEANYDYYGASGVIDKVEDYIFDEPTILIGEDGANLYSRSSPLAFIASGKYWVNNHAHILKPRKGKIRFFCYLLEAFDYTTLISGSAQPKLTAGQLNRVQLMVPPIAEQQAIANYLDTKTAQIDRQIDLLSQKAAQYGKLKQSLINETVTRGLDKTVAMKDSGVEWIGEVPAHWEIKHFKQFSSMKGRIGWQGLKHSEFIDEGPFLITGMNFKAGRINWDEVYHITIDRYEQAPEIQLKENDVLMTKDGTIGKLLFVDAIPAPYKASLNSHLLVFRPIKNSYVPRYIYYQLDSSLFQSYVETVKAGTTFFGISQAAVGRYIAVLPPKQEQQAIANYLDEKTAHIDRVVATINSQIDKLKELRKTLINDIVSGKICVFKPEHRHE